MCRICASLHAANESIRWGIQGLVGYKLASDSSYLLDYLVSFSSFCHGGPWIIPWHQALMPGIWDISRMVSWQPGRGAKRWGWDPVVVVGWLDTDGLDMTSHDEGCVITKYSQWVGESEINDLKPLLWTLDFDEDDAEAGEVQGINLRSPHF